MEPKGGAKHQDPVAKGHSRPQSPQAFSHIPSFPKVNLPTQSRRNSIATESLGRGSDHTEGSYDEDIPQHEFKILDENSLTNLVDPWKSQMVLSLDSGGLRALSELHVLKALMCEIKNHEKDKNAFCSWASPLMLPTRTPDAEHSYLPCHYFDYVGGASLGGLCAIMLGRLSMSVDEAIQAVEAIARSGCTKRDRLNKVPRMKLTRRPRKQNRSANTEVLLEKLKPYLLERDIAPELHLNKLFSSDLRPTDNERCKSLFIDPSTQGNEFIFRSYVTNTSKSFQIELIEAARRTLQKPPSSKFPGALGSKPTSQNRSSTALFPTWNVYDQIHRDVITRGSHRDVSFGNLKSLGSNVPSAHIALLISIGSPPSISPSQDRSSIKPKAKQVSGKETAKLEAQLQRKSAEENEFFYERISGPPGLSKIMQNEWNMNCSPEMLSEIENITRKHCESEEISAKLRRCARTLVEARHQRAQTRHWERFALGTDYICRFCPDPLKGPGRKPQFHGDQYSLIEHLQRVHDAPPPDASLYNDYLEILKNFRVTAQRQ